MAFPFRHDPDVFSICQIDLIHAGRHEAGQAITCGSVGVNIIPEQFPDIRDARHKLILNVVVNPFHPFVAGDQPDAPILGQRRVKLVHFPRRIICHVFETVFIFRQAGAERIALPFPGWDRVFNTGSGTVQGRPDRPQDNLVACPILNGVGSEPTEVIQRLDHTFAGRARGWAAFGDHQGVELVDIFYSAFSHAEVIIVIPPPIQITAGDR